MVTAVAEATTQEATTFDPTPGDTGNEGVLKYIAARELQLDRSYQSEERFKLSAAEKIVAEFQWEVFNPIKVCRYIGDSVHYWVVDGQHRLWAALSRFGPDVKLPCYDIGTMTPQEAATIFSRQAQGVRAISAYVSYAADLFAGEQYAIDLQRTVEAAGWQITPMGGRGNSKQGQLYAVNELRRIQRGKDGLSRIEDILDIVTAAWDDDPDGVSQQMLSALNRILRYYYVEGGLDTDHLIERLREYTPKDITHKLSNSIGLEMGQKPSPNNTMPTTIAILRLYNKGLRKAHQLQPKSVG